MPRIGGVEVRTCLECGSPYCGSGNGAPGWDCKGRLGSIMMPVQQDNYKKCTICLGTGKQLGMDYDCFNCRGKGEVKNHW